MLSGRSVNTRPIVRREQAEWRREQLLEAALQMFGQHGVETATVKDIARRAGVSPGLIHHYFDGKEALVIAVVERFGFLEILKQRLGEGSDRPVMEVLTNLANEFSSLLESRKELISVFFTGFANPRVRKAFDSHAAEGQNALATFLASRVVTGELREHDYTAAAQMLIATVVITRLTEKPANPTTVVELLIHGLLKHQESAALTLAGPTVTEIPG